MKVVSEEVEEERKRKVVHEVEGVYNSLHWQVSFSELLNETTQMMKKFSSANLTCTKQAKHVLTGINNCATTFSKLRARPWRKRKRWCHELNSY